VPCREEANRELMASVVTEDVIRAMVVCSEEGYVVYWGCRLLYNVCYRSEAGQDVILSRSALLKVIDVSEYNHAGDPDVLRQIVRLKLAVLPAGWRGSVEEDIERQMRALGLGKPVPADLSAAGPKQRRVRSARQSQKGGPGDDPRLSGKSRGAKDEEEDDEEKARLEDKDFRNYEVVSSYAYAYGNADSVAFEKEARHFRKLLLESPKYQENKEPLPEDGKAAEVAHKADGPGTGGAARGQDRHGQEGCGWRQECRGAGGHGGPPAQAGHGGPSLPTCTSWTRRTFVECGRRWGYFVHTTTEYIVRLAQLLTYNCY
jgi:hypothetical protein